MCGITGWIDLQADLRSRQNIIETMTRTLAPRGPDADGYYTSANALLGHRRLIVVDPAGGAQPMIRSKGEREYVLVYNGELYNTPELRAELKARGYTFQGHSDTEVLLNSYIEWGPGCLRRLNGIFAFAVWDPTAYTLFMGRDRLGVKPLFFHKQGSTLLFGSELKAILAHPDVKPQLDTDGLAEIFVMGPARTPGHGIFHGIDELNPGNWLEFSRRGTRRGCYWQLESRLHLQSPQETIHTVKELFCDTVERQLVSDVPVCTLLSGGLDSSAITTLAAKVMKSKQLPLHTYSVDFTGNKEHFTANEFQPAADNHWIELVARYVGTEHHSVEFDTPELLDALHTAMLARDLPGMTDIDGSLYLFSQKIKQTATVGLSGECADEIFGGYPWFHRSDLVNVDFFPWYRNFDERMQFLAPWLTEHVKPQEYAAQRYQQALDEVPRLPGETGHDARIRELLYLCITRWMPTLLDRKDRMTMATGLEVRVPFCDHRLVEYAWNIPWDIKNMGGQEKGVLRQAMNGLLPQEVLTRRKSPYPKTHNPSYLDATRKQLLDILSDPSSPLIPFVNVTSLKSFAQKVTPQTHFPWFGQLMNVPQLFAYYVQVNNWLKTYTITVK